MRTKQECKQAGGTFSTCNKRRSMVVIIGAKIDYSRVGGHKLEPML